MQRDGKGYFLKFQRVWKIPLVSPCERSLIIETVLILYCNISTQLNDYLVIVLKRKLTDVLNISDTQLSKILLKKYKETNVDQLKFLTRRSFCGSFLIK